MVNVFISHGITDKDYAIELANELQLQNINVWLDYANLPAGTDWQTAITQALKSADILIALISSTETSRNSLIEIGMAWGLGKKIIPIILPGESRAELPMIIQELHALDANNKTIRDIASQVSKVVKNTSYN